MTSAVVALLLAAVSAAAPTEAPLVTVAQAEASDPSDVGAVSDPQDAAPDASAEPATPPSALPDADPAPSFLLPRPWDATLAGAVGCTICGGPFACVSGAMMAFAVMLFSSAVAEGGWGGCILALGAVMVGIFSAVPGMVAGPASSAGTCAGGSILALFTDRKVWPFIIGLIPGLTVGLFGAALTLSPIVLADMLEPMALDAGLQPPLVTIGIAAVGILIGLSAGPLSVASVTYADVTFNGDERASAPATSGSPDASRTTAVDEQEGKRASPPTPSEMRPALAVAF